MRKLALALGVLAGIVTVACSSVTTAVDYDHTVNWSQFHTFQIAEGTKDPVTFTQKRISDEIQQTLTEKGWTATDADKADAIVLLHGATEKQKSLNTFYSGGYGGYGYRGWGGMGGMGTATTTTSEYLVGTLVVDIFDAKSKSLMFRGTATDELSDKPEKNAKKLAKVTDKMFKDFPPGSKK